MSSPTRRLLFLGEPFDEDGRHASRRDFMMEMLAPRGQSLAVPVALRQDRDIKVSSLNWRLRNGTFVLDRIA
jgi:hypothetical protein